MTGHHNSPKISRELARRLFPLAMALCFLLSVFMPGLYCFLEYRKIKEEAGAYSRQFAEKIKQLVSASPDLWKYQATKYSQIISSFIPDTGISTIAILDDRAQSITQYYHTNSTDRTLGLLEIKGTPAAIIFNNRRLGEIQIGISADFFILNAGLVFLACLLTGIPLSVLIYKLPLQIVTKLESQLIDYQQTLEEKAKLEELSRQFQKNESLHRMAGAIAHHFNNQLGVVIGNLEMAIEGTPSDAGSEKNLTEALKGALKAAEVSGLMLTYLGQTTGKHAALDLGEICRRCLPLLQAAIPKDILFKINLPASGPVVNANASRIQQVLTNLVSNAWEAVGKKERTISLTIKTIAPEEIPKTHRFPIGWQVTDKPYACMEIKDTGCGIAEKDIEKIFDPFFSTKFTGRGLGLPVVLGIVKAHDGGITLASKLGEGSTFQVFFPVSPEESFPPGRSDCPAIQSS
jgi:signal transduction histidine kinase